jgi:hypothetical protein
MQTGAGALKYHRSEIRKLLGFREVAVADSEELADWLCEHCLVETRRTERIEDAAIKRLRALRIEPPTPERLGRLIRSAVHQFDQGLCESVIERLPASTCKRLEALLDNIDDQETEPVQNSANLGTIVFKFNWLTWSGPVYLHADDMIADRQA